MVDLNQKAKWHVEQNGGYLPVLEAPDGAMVNETALLLQFASDYAGSEGLALTPSENAKPGDAAAHMKTVQMKLD